ncbi:receptor-type protein kinase, putative [Bodo saltans]|uniref:Receptor-type protein kinase, putative n=1 Tax=Bodo saltans TaxID=75058 RepID=A0A0S4JFE2_BODSA|nr:receptor-type protein kinase, putative [Bodo saltans]|eukprot:CUG90215.1 receptor-type protein kinase, putative [Bodo saltans]
MPPWASHSPRDDVRDDQLRFSSCAVLTSVVSPRSISSTPIVSMTSQSSRLRSLQHLDVSGLILQQCAAQLPSLASLQRLDMSHCCDLLASDLCTILALSHLTHLNLWYCSGAPDTVLSSIALLYELRYLNLRGCGSISDEGLTHLFALEKLECLHISFCMRITDAFIEAFQKYVRTVVRETFTFPTCQFVGAWRSSGRPLRCG